VLKDVSSFCAPASMAQSIANAVTRCRIIVP
jgi:hypothetical protein